MEQISQTWPVQGAPVAAFEECEQLYLRVRKLLAEAQSRSITATEQSRWQVRSTRARRLRAMLDATNLADVLEAIAALHTEQGDAAAGVAAQLAASAARSHR